MVDSFQEDDLRYLYIYISNIKKGIILEHTYRTQIKAAKNNALFTKTGSTLMSDKGEKEGDKVEG